MVQPTLQDKGVYQPEWSPWVRQAIIIGMVIAAVYALTLLSPIITLLITTFLLSFLIYVPARALAVHTPLNYSVSVLVIFGIILLGICIFVVVLVPNIVDLLRNIAAGVADRWEQLQASLLAWNPAETPYTIPVFGLFNLDVTPVAVQLRALLIEPDRAIAQQLAQSAILENLPAIDPGQIVGVVTAIIAALLGAFSQFLSTLFLGLFLSLLILLDLPRYQSNVLSSVASQYQRETRLLTVKVTRVWQGFFRGQLLLCIIIGLLTFIQLAVMGIPGALPLAAIVALISLIPSIGGIIALFPLALVPLLQGSTILTQLSNTSVALLVVGVNLVISQVIWNVVAPKIMGEAVSLPLPVIIVGIIIGTALGGVLGAFLIVPILGTIRVIVLYLIAKVRRLDPFPGEETPEFVELAKV
jgi:predicted PurR-regulated permease PerM